MKNRFPCDDTQKTIWLKVKIGDHYQLISQALINKHNQGIRNWMHSEKYLEEEFKSLFEPKNQENE